MNPKSKREIKLCNILLKSDFFNGGDLPKGYKGELEYFLVKLSDAGKLSESGVEEYKEDLEKRERERKHLLMEENKHSLKRLIIKTIIISIITLTIAFIFGLFVENKSKIFQTLFDFLTGLFMFKK